MTSTLAFLVAWSTAAWIRLALSSIFYKQSKVYTISVKLQSLEISISNISNCTLTFFGSTVDRCMDCFINGVFANCSKFFSAKSRLCSVCHWIGKIHSYMKGHCNVLHMILNLFVRLHLSHVLKLHHCATIICYYSHEHHGSCRITSYTAK